MITTEELFELIEKYLFAFSSKEDAIKHIFNNDLNFYTKLDEKEIEKRINKNLIKYFRKQFESNKLPTLIKKYIKSNKLKRLSKNDMMFLDNIIIETEYEVTYEDLEKLLKIKQIEKYLKVAVKDEIELVEKLREFIELQESEEEVEEEEEEKEEEYDGADIEKLYERDAKRYELLTKEQERYYIKKYQEEDDPEAFDILVGSNQGLCKKVAARYEGRGLSKLDLIQEGNFGLMKCLKKFDLKRDTKLSTYAMWWIDQAMQKGIKDLGRTIRIPVHIIDSQDKLNRIENKFIATHGYEPTIEELVELTGFAAEQIKKLKDSDLKMVSFDKKVQTDDDSGSTLGEFIKSDIETPEELADIAADHDVLEGYLERLITDQNEKDGKREAQILRLRFGIELYNDESYRLIKKAGLEVKDKYILEDVAKMFGVTRERIRQLQNRGINTIIKYSIPYKRQLEVDDSIQYKKKKKNKKEEE